MANPKYIQRQGDHLALVLDDGSQVTAYATHTDIWIISGSEPPVPPPDPSIKRFIMPFAEKHVGSEFGMRNGRLHAGRDFGEAGITAGTDIIASAAGTVWKRQPSGTWGGYGNTLILDHGSGLFTLYAHILNGGFRVNVGDTVTQGQHIAEVGNTGASGGNHLHFETHEGGYRWNESARDPRLFIPKYNGA